MKLTFKRFILGFMASAYGIAPITNALADDAGAQQIGAATVITLPDQGSQAAGGGIDYENAKPMPLPRVDNYVAPAFTGQPSFPGAAKSYPGAHGNGKEAPLTVPKTKAFDDQSSISSQEFGSFNHPFTTSRANTKGASYAKLWPTRATGRLFFSAMGGTFVCSAALIKPGIVVTAAHCVAEFGTNRFHSNWQFIPAYNDGNAPFGTWSAASATVLTSYLDGTDPCLVAGVVCANDIALIRLKPQDSPLYPGDSTGWYGYGVNGYSYTTFLETTSAQISQLGYPVALDDGLLMQRTDSLGYVDPTFSNNTVIGSLQTGGSSGGPWLVNMGVKPALNGTTIGAAANHNIVVGVTSWGYTSTTPKEQGASPFTSDNIEVLVNTLCSPAPQPGC
ncbi:MAG: trypsin-like serine peptidase [Methylococcaceae bacterium]